MIKATVYIKEKSTGRYHIIAEDEEDLQCEIDNLEIGDVQWDLRYPDFEILKIEKQYIN